MARLPLAKVTFRRISIEKRCSVRFSCPYSVMRFRYAGRLQGIYPCRVEKIGA